MRYIILHKKGRRAKDLDAILSCDVMVAADKKQYILNLFLFCFKI